MMIFENYKYQTYILSNSKDQTDIYPFKRPNLFQSFLEIQTTFT